MIVNHDIVAKGNMWNVVRNSFDCDLNETNEVVFEGNYMDCCIYVDDLLLEQDEEEMED